MNANYLLRLARLVMGLFIYALGVVVQIKAHVGYAPWDIFHTGLASTLGLTLGQVSIGVGMIIVVVDILLKEKIGLGTFFNMFLIGLFIDLIMKLDFIPQSSSPWSGYPMLILGLFLLSFGLYFYMSSAFGAGPRDTLMVAIHRRLGVSVGLAKAMIEITVAFLGWRLGGMLGLGTVIAASLIGVVLQFVLRLMRFEPKNVTHETLKDTMRLLVGKQKA